VTELAGRYSYFLIKGFLPTFTNRLDGRMSPSTFRDESEKEAKKYYSISGYPFPKTKRLINFDENTSLYALKLDVADLIFMLKAKNMRDAIKAYDSIRYLLAFALHYYTLDLDLIPLASRPPFTELKRMDLVKLALTDGIYSDPDILSSELIEGLMVTDKDIKAIEKQLRIVFKSRTYRRALACLYQSQLIYYTHLVGSYVGSHSRPDLISTSRAEFTANNFQFEEMLNAALFTCYRGVEALYSKNFRTADFQSVNKNGLESYLDGRLPSLPSRSKYRLRLYRQRELNPPKHMLVISMLEIIFRARNRAAHGHRWRRRSIHETFGLDLVHESKFFLGELIAHALWE